MVAAESLQWAWRCQVEDGRQLISCAIFVNFKLCHCKLNVWTSNIHFSCWTPRATRGPARGPDVVHHWPMSCAAPMKVALMEISWLAALLELADRSVKIGLESIVEER